MIKARTSRVVLTLVATVASACGGSSSSPTGVSTAPPSTVLTITAGDTGGAVAGATVVAGMANLTTNAQGQVAVTGTIGTALAITASGFLDRLTKLESVGSASLTLWPRTTANGLTEATTLAIVYDNNKQAMTRWGSGSVALVPSAQIAADPQSMSALVGAASRITNATHGHMTVTVDPNATTGAIIQAVIDPSRSLFGAAAYVNTKNHAATGGLIAYAGLSAVREEGIDLHELSHFYGFVESPDTIDIAGPGPGLRTDFSARELTLLDLMWQRRPGNAWPDNDQGVSTTGASAVRVFQCHVG